MFAAWKIMKFMGGLKSARAQRRAASLKGLRKGDKLSNFVIEVFAFVPRDEDNSSTEASKNEKRHQPL